MESLDILKNWGLSPDLYQFPSLSCSRDENHKLLRLLIPSISIKERKFHLSLQFLLLPGNKSFPAGTAAFFVTHEKAEPFTGNEVMSDGLGVLGNFPG